MVEEVLGKIKILFKKGFFKVYRFYAVYTWDVASYTNLLPDD